MICLVCGVQTPTINRVFCFLLLRRDELQPTLQSGVRPGFSLPDRYFRDPARARAKMADVLPFRAERSQRGLRHVSTCAAGALGEGREECSTRRQECLGRDR